MGAQQAPKWQLRKGKKKKDHFDSSDPTNGKDHPSYPRPSRQRKLLQKKREELKIAERKRTMDAPVELVPSTHFPGKHRYRNY
jgi:hypothetical protein